MTGGRKEEDKSLEALIAEEMGEIPPRSRVSISITIDKDLSILLKQLYEQAKNRAKESDQVIPSWSAFVEMLIRRGIKTLTKT